MITSVSPDTASYLRRQGLEPDVEIDSLELEQAVEYAIEIAYYQACLSDSTHHGINHNGKVNTITRAVKHWPQFENPDDFATLDRAVGNVVRHRSASGIAGDEALEIETAVERAVAEIADTRSS